MTHEELFKELLSMGELFKELLSMGFYENDHNDAIEYCYYDEEKNGEFTVTYDIWAFKGTIRHYLSASFESNDKNCSNDRYCNNTLDTENSPKEILDWIKNYTPKPKISKTYEISFKITTDLAPQYLQSQSRSGAFAYSFDNKIEELGENFTIEQKF